MFIKYFEWLDRMVCYVEVQKNVTLMLCHSFLLTVNLIFMMLFDIDYSLSIAFIFLIIYYFRGMYLIRKALSKHE